MFNVSDNKLEQFQFYCGKPDFMLMTKYGCEVNLMDFFSILDD